LIRTVAGLVGARPDLAERLQVLIMGDGPERPRLERLIQEANLGEIIELLGTRTDVHEMMSRSDLQLMTSDYEGLPITLIEAAHAGLPIVATDVGGCSEIVEHGRNGFLAPAGDDSALAKHIEALIDDPKLRKEFSRASLRVAQQFSITANADQHLALYQRVLERAGN
jgi:glycosyltransferase involved in cell wall biosynthesis